MPRHRHARLGVLLLSSALTAVAAAGPASRARAYLFSYFTGNGEDGLHLASSEDGLRWTPLRGGRSFLAPAVGSKLMRDPSIAEGPDGSFHLVWTTGWWDKGIGIAHSRDLVTWSAQKRLPVMEHEALARNCWAPEIFYDAASGRYLVFWSTAIPGRFPDTEATGDASKVYGGHLDHRIYFVATRDFESYTEPRLLFDGGFDVIDATLVHDAGRYALVVKDETRFPEPRKHIRVAFALRAEGPFRDVSGPISPDWVEGPSVLRIGETWMLYYDEYTRHRYGAARSTDLQRWEVVASGLEFPEGARHGTAFTAPRDVLQRLKALAPD